MHSDHGVCACASVCLCAINQKEQSFCASACVYCSLSLSLSRSLTQIDSVIPHRTTTAAAAVDARPASASGAAQRVAVGVDVRKHIQKRIMTSVCVCVCVCEGFFIYPYFPSSHASTLPFVLWQRNTDGKKNLKPIPGADSGCGPKTKNTPTYQLQLNCDYLSLSLSRLCSTPGDLS